MVQFRRLATFILGAWLAASMMMDVVAISNFHAVNRLLANPGIQAAERIHVLGEEDTRTLLRQAAGESNAFLFEQWEWTQLGTGLCLLLVLIFGHRPPPVPILICLVMMAIVMVDRFALTPVIASLGKVIDYLPLDANLPERKRFGIFHGAYGALEIAKLILGFVIAGMLLFKRRHDPEIILGPGEAIEEAGYRHLPK